MLFVTYNIQFGCGRDGRIDLDRIAAAIKDADVVALQEVERDWRPDQPHPDQAARLAELLSRHHWVHGATTDLDGSAVGADGRVTNRRRRFGNMILSRWPIASTRTLPLPTLPVSGEINDQSSMLEAVVDHGPHAFRVYNIHLNHISRRQRLTQLGIAVPFIQESSRRGGMISAPNFKGELPVGDWLVLPNGRLPPMPPSVIFAGDFNSEPDSPEYDLLTGPRDPVYGRVTEADRFADVLTLSGLAEGEGITFPASSGKPGARIDHCLVSMDLIPSVRRAWIDNEADGSDHQPVWMEIDL
jgi:endonuclease/exonuclease/phosphatase family metal-dependent hydrolase